MLIIRPTWNRWSVRSISISEGLTSPLGWLCTIITCAQPFITDQRNTFMGSTTVFRIPPMLINSTYLMRRFWARPTTQKCSFSLSILSSRRRISFIILNTSSVLWIIMRCLRVSFMVMGCIFGSMETNVGIFWIGKLTPNSQSKLYMLSYLYLSNSPCKGKLL